MMKKTILFCILMLIISVNVSAHDAWIEKKGNNFNVVYGHGVETESYVSDKVKEVKAYDANGNIVQAVIEKEGYPVIIKPKGNAAVITLYFDNGFWSKTPDGWKNKPKKEQPDAVESSHSVKCSKAMSAWSDKLSKPLGMKMEIVPLSNPFLVKAGGSLPIKVFLDGKPAEGASVNIGGYHKEDMKTDRNGMADVKIEKTGSQIIAASIKIPLKDNPNADILSISTNITFEVK